MAALKSSRYGKRKKTIAVASLVISVAIVVAACTNNTETFPAGRPEKEHVTKDGGQVWADEITIMHDDAGKREFETFICRAEETLQIKIHVVPCPDNADSRHARVSSLLAAGDSSVDIFTLNDEMISQFKYAGYLEPLQEDVMKPEIAAVFPQEYLEQIAMIGDQIYSVPYRMDILALWINENWLNEIGIENVRSRENFLRFLNHDWGEERYGYGGSWEKTYVYNEVGEFINLFGGDYYDWDNENTRQAVCFLKECVEAGTLSLNQLIDQHEQMNQKFIDGKYGMVLMYTGAIATYMNAGVYGSDQIHLTGLPALGGDSTYIATWQYVLNRASENKDAAKRFLNYAAGREGSRLYAETLKYLPAREDLIWQEKLDIDGFEQIRDFLRTVRLQARPLPENSMEYISKEGQLFQLYVMGEISLDNYCNGMQRLVDEAWGR